VRPTTVIRGAKYIHIHSNTYIDSSS
jgi:hypothetical protein